MKQTKTASQPAIAGFSKAPYHLGVAGGLVAFVGVVGALGHATLPTVIPPAGDYQLLFIVLLVVGLAIVACSYALRLWPWSCRGLRRTGDENAVALGLRLARRWPRQVGQFFDPIPTGSGGHALPGLDRVTGDDGAVLVSLRLPSGTKPPGGLESYLTSGCAEIKAVMGLHAAEVTSDNRLRLVPVDVTTTARGVVSQ